MSDPNPSAPPPYTNAPPPAYPPGGYPPAGYRGWQPPSPAYHGPALPAWLTFGGILVLLGGALVLIGFIVSLVGWATYANSASANAFTSYAASMEAFDALVGVGIFLVVLGWLFHQMSQHRRSGP
ncbi:MAG: hypothetical protein ACRECT_04635 [Thermoplasmata archaeon]